MTKINSRPAAGFVLQFSILLSPHITLYKTLV